MEVEQPNVENIIADLTEVKIGEFFNVLIQIVSKYKLNDGSVVLRVWDGSNIRNVVNLHQVNNEDQSIVVESSFEPILILDQASQRRAVDIFCYDYDKYVSRRVHSGYWAVLRNCILEPITVDGQIKYRFVMRDENKPLIFVPSLHELTNSSAERKYQSRKIEMSIYINEVTAKLESQSCIPLCDVPKAEPPQGFVHDSECGPDAPIVRQPPRKPLKLSDAEKQRKNALYKRMMKIKQPFNK